MLFRSPAQSAGFFFTGVKPVVALRTREGHALKLTADHKVLRVRSLTRYARETEWVAAGELRTGDQIVLQNQRQLSGWAGVGTEAERTHREAAAAVRLDRPVRQRREVEDPHSGLPHDSAGGV